MMPAEQMAQLSYGRAGPPERISGVGDAMARMRTWGVALLMGGAEVGPEAWCAFDLILGLCLSL